METAMHRFARSLALAVLLAAPAAWAQLTVAGVKYDDAAELAGSKLALNGAGLRVKFVFKVYAMGLYLPRKSATPEEVLALQGPKRISLTMLREVDAGEFSEAFAKGMSENNDAATLARLAPGVQRMNQLFADQKKLMTGDTVSIDWIPGTGTQIRIKGAAAGEPFADPAFFTAMLRIWLGAHPADASLKEALLGKPA
jgi:hypothetical protein